MNNKWSIKLKIFFLLLLTLAGLGLASFLILPLFRKESVSQPVASLPPTTGAIEAPTTSSPEETLKNEQFSNLKDNLPLETEAFIIKFSYEHNRFVVTVYPPFEQNEEVFYDWLTDNDYYAIEEKYFEIRLEQETTLENTF